MTGVRPCFPLGHGKRASRSAPPGQHGVTAPPMFKLIGSHPQHRLARAELQDVAPARRRSCSTARPRGHRPPGPWLQHDGAGVCRGLHACSSPASSIRAAAAARLLRCPAAAGCARRRRRRVEEGDSRSVAAAAWRCCCLDVRYSSSRRPSTQYSLGGVGAGHLSTRVAR